MSFLAKTATWAEYLGIVPSRFARMEPGMDRMFAMCRGCDGATALSKLLLTYHALLYFHDKTFSPPLTYDSIGMKKWIDSNYHYMVPEVDDSLDNLAPDFSAFIADVKRGIATLGARATPVILGPISMTRFVVFKQKQMKMCAGVTYDLQQSTFLQKLLPIYAKLFLEVAAMGVEEIQIHEPSLVFAETALTPLFKKAYTGATSILPPKGLCTINMVSFFEDIGEENYKWLVETDRVDIVSLDFTRGDNMSLIKKFGFPATKILGAGVIDGRSVWKLMPSKVVDILKSLDVANVRIQPSSSLQFVPWTLECETELLNHTAGPVLSFGKQKVLELVAVAQNDVAFLVDAESKWADYTNALAADMTVANRVAALTKADFSRSVSFSIRSKQQLRGLPILPTTTIGSFPQTKEIRSLRNQFIRKKITQAEYEAKIDQQISFMIGIQEALDLDILVHGEPERTDMVEYFGQKMDGMLFSRNGWVQSFGSRCVRPPIFWNDISRPSAMTVREFKVAQSLTSKPVKGMLTGPVTILNWSFPRVDIPRSVQAMHIALALRDEIFDLEQAGCRVIQVDEPALREAMPLRPQAKEEYLTWTVDSFLLATAGALPETQIHTHMCYCEFEDCMGAIDRLDCDVSSIENARSDDATLRAFKAIGFGKGLGPGTYDIHSPVVPPVALIEDKIRMFLGSVDPSNLVINPDCGLKTRTWPETLESLKNMVQATKTIRAEILSAA